MEARHRQAAPPRFPFPAYPRGWFALARTAQIPDDGAVVVHRLGRDWRVARAGDGYTVTAQGRQDPRPCRQRGPFVLVWHCANGAEPDYDVPEFPEVAAPGWQPYQVGRWRIRSHPQELMENGADTAHFRVVHFMEAPRTDVAVDGPLLSFRTAATREVLAADDAVSFHTLCYGLGFSSNRYWGQLDAMMFIGITPIDGREVEVTLAFTFLDDEGTDARRRFGRDYGRYVFEDFERDIPLWEHQRVRAEPVLCDGDGPIGVVREWAAQFYTDDAARRPS